MNFFQVLPGDLWFLLHRGYFQFDLPASLQVVQFVPDPVEKILCISRLPVFFPYNLKHTAHSRDTGVHRPFKKIHRLFFQHTLCLFFFDLITGLILNLLFLCLTDLAIALVKISPLSIGHSLICQLLHVSLPDPEF